MEQRRRVRRGRRREGRGSRSRCCADRDQRRGLLQRWMRREGVKASVLWAGRTKQSKAGRREEAGQREVSSLPRPASMSRRTCGGDAPGVLEDAPAQRGRSELSVNAIVEAGGLHRIRSSAPQESSWAKSGCRLAGVAVRRVRPAAVVPWLKRTMMMRRTDRKEAERGDSGCRGSREEHLKHSADARRFGRVSAKT